MSIEHGSFPLPEIRGKGLTPARKEKIRKKLEKRRESATREIKGETERSPERLRQIALANEILAEEFAALGLSYAPIPPESVHYLPSGRFEKVAGNPWDTAATFDPESRSIAIQEARSGKGWELFNERWESEEILDRVWEHVVYKEECTSEDQDERDAYHEAAFVRELERLHALRERVTLAASDYENFPALLHEAIHAAGYASVSARRLPFVRTGYFMAASGGPEEALGEAQHFVHFTSLNEATVEKLNMDLLLRHADRIERADLPIDKLCEEAQTGITDVEMLLHGEEELRKEIKGGSYPFEREILDLIIDRIAKQKGESTAEVWARFKKGHFSGNMMHLRDIEDAFGKGTLRVYANISPWDVLSSEEAEADDGRVHQGDIRRFFTTTDAVERVALGEKILAQEEHELAQYRKRLEKHEDS